MRKEGIMEGTDTPKVKVSTEMAARLGAVPLAGRYIVTKSVSWIAQKQNNPAVRRLSC